MNPYSSYYSNQVGSGLGGFQGLRYQKGHGFFGKLFGNTILPFFKQLLPSLVKRLLPSGIGLAQDIFSGENVGQSAKKRLREVGENVADETLNVLKSRFQKGGKRKRRHTTSRRRKTNKNIIKLKKSRKAYKKKRKRRKTLNFLK